MKATAGGGADSVGSAPSACCGRSDGDNRPSFCGTGWLSGSTGEKEEEEEEGEAAEEEEQPVWAERAASCSGAASCGCWGCGCCCCC